MLICFLCQAILKAAPLFLVSGGRQSAVAAASYSCTSKYMAVMAVSDLVLRVFAQFELFVCTKFLIFRGKTSLNFLLQLQLSSLRPASAEVLARSNTAAHFIVFFLRSTSLLLPRARRHGHTLPAGTCCCKQGYDRQRRQRCCTTTGTPVPILVISCAQRPTRAPCCCDAWRSAPGSNNAVGTDGVQCCCRCTLYGVESMHAGR